MLVALNFIAVSVIDFMGGFCRLALEFTSSGGLALIFVWRERAVERLFVPNPAIMPFSYFFK
jgi:hypothetical protein